MSPTKASPKSLTPGAEQFRRTFQKVWVAGTAGGFFSALVGAVPTIWSQRASFGHIDPSFTALQYARHLYLIWLAVYFALSQMRREHLDSRVRGQDIWFDVLQSAIAFVAVCFLGFSKGPDLVAQSLRNTGITASIAIAAISVLALLFFSRDDIPAVVVRGVTLNKIRVFGLIWSIIGFAVFWRAADTHPAILIGVLLAGHALALFGFAYISELGITKAAQPWTLGASLTRSSVAPNETGELALRLTNNLNDWRLLPRDEISRRPLLELRRDETCHRVGNPEPFRASPRGRVPREASRGPTHLGWLSVGRRQREEGSSRGSFSNRAALRWSAG